MKTPDRMTSIVATIGPATSDEASIKRLARAGMNVARINFSHADHTTARSVYRRVRKVSRELDHPIGIMADLQGPKVRLGRFDGPLEIKRGRKLVLTTRFADADPESNVLPVAYKPLPIEVERDDEILMADGTVRVRVERVRGERVFVKILEGRVLNSRAGLGLPTARATATCLTSKDKKDLAFAVELGVDFIALSFVRRPDDLKQTRRLIKRHGGEQMLIAKIETVQAVANLDEILEESDAVMVARGDLGVELPPEKVPFEQKRIIAAAGAAAKPVITATQMLESMRKATRPTRAEASDVANAVSDGSWALMLSAETATGSYPTESVKMMDRIICEAEQTILKPTIRRRMAGSASMSVSEGIAEAANWLAFSVGASAIVALTRSGSSARQIARHLPTMTTFAYTPSQETLTKMTLYRGIIPRMLGRRRTLSRAVQGINDDLRTRRDLRRGDIVVILSGSPGEPYGLTNRMVVHQIR